MVLSLLPKELASLLAKLHSTPKTEMFPSAQGNQIIKDQLLSSINIIFLHTYYYNNSPTSPFAFFSLLSSSTIIIGIPISSSYWDFLPSVPFFAFEYPDVCKTAMVTKVAPSQMPKLRSGTVIPHPELASKLFKQ